MTGNRSLLEDATLSAINLHRSASMKTKFGCIVLPCGCLVSLFVIALALLGGGGVVLAKALF